MVGDVVGCCVLLGRRKEEILVLGLGVERKSKVGNGRIGRKMNFVVTLGRNGGLYGKGMRLNGDVVYSVMVEEEVRNGYRWWP